MIKDASTANDFMQATASAVFAARIAEARGLFQDNHAAQAEALLRTLHGREPASEDAATLLAEVQRSQGQLSAAAQTLLALCGANGFEPGLSLRCAGFARQCDRHAVAERICEGALARGAVPAELLVLAGNIARERGDFDVARAHYHAALDAGIDLDRHHVLGALADTRRYMDPGDPEIARFARHFADTRYSTRSRASAGFALAKAHDDLENHAAAAAILREANTMVRGVQPWDSAAWRRFVGARLRETVASKPADDASDFTPVFIVGVPRTGTTLTASLLARATGARDRGELRALRYIAEQLTNGGHLRNPAALTEAAHLYRMLAVQDDPPARWYLDQDPLNFRWLHLAAAMFPQARVVHLRRDRRDTALSLWGRDFAHPDLAFAYGFDDMAAFMTGHDKLMQHWARTLSLPVCDLDYETLVVEPDATLAKLRAFIGADDAEPAVEPDAAPVQSASVWQARQPVYSTSVGRWKHYAPYVPELAAFAGPALTIDPRRD